MIFKKVFKKFLNIFYFDVPLYILYIKDKFIINKNIKITNIIVMTFPLIEDNTIKPPKNNKLT